MIQLLNDSIIYLQPTCYKNKMIELTQKYPNSKSLNLDYDDLDKYNIELADELIEKPYQIIQAVKDSIVQMDLISPTGKKVEPHVRFFNMPHEHKVLLRNLNSDQINKFITVDGLVTKATDVKPKIITGVFECKNCLRRTNVKQEEQSSKLTEPTQCACGHKGFEIILEECEFVDTQKIEVQEPITQSSSLGIVWPCVGATLGLPSTKPTR